ncbi:MAG: ADP-glyceromanno-heptose 6-epimerase [Rhodospirillales bacterium]|nr:ADP-glyceromanno-heptose 6-epimerase [Rhodospirillales bacterium]
MFVVTGGAGFIGSNIVAALDEKRSGAVVVCDRLGNGDKWRNIAKRELTDIVAPENLMAFLDANRDAIEMVFHMGAVSSTTETDADLIVDANFKLSLAIWSWCAAHGVRLVYASSAATYGDGGQGFDDDASPAALSLLRPLNPYGWSKHLFDRRIARLAADGAAAPPQWVGLKFFNVYGPNEYHKDDMKSVVAQIYPGAADGKAARLFKSHHPDYTDGGQMRDFVWIEDCVDIALWFMDNPQVLGLFNCGTGEARTFVDLASAVYHALGKEPLIEYRPTPEALRERYQYFTEAAMDRLFAAGYPRDRITSLEHGVTQYVQGYLSGPDPYR